MSDITPEQKQKFKELQENKKQLIEQLLSINNMLDTYRTNLNILIYNIYSNNQIKNLPDFNYDDAKKLAQELGSLLIGVKNEYTFKNFHVDNDEGDKK